MPLPVVSVVIPSFNYGHLVSEAVESVLDQTYPNVEIIVVDDGSTDDTRQTLAKYGDRIRYHYQENAGLSAARNTGIALAKGDLIALLDSDDAFHPNKLDVQVHYLESNPDISLVATDSFSDEPRHWNDVIASTLAMPVELVGLETIVMNSRFSPSSVLLRRACFAHVGMFDTELKSVEDRDMWIRIAHCLKVAVIHLPLTWYRQTPGSMSRNAEKMERFEDIVLNKAFDLDKLKGAHCLRRRALAVAKSSAAWMYLQSDNQAAAIVRLISSFAYWPLPLGRTASRDQPFVRARLLARAMRELLLRIRQSSTAASR